MPEDMDYAELLITDPVLAGTTEPEPKRARARLPRSTRPWARVWLSELGDRRLFPPALRLLLVLRYRSYEGQEMVRLTEDITAEAGISNRIRHRYARQLERCGVVRVEREGQHSLLITVLPSAR
jgi:hypothetical protein